MKIRISFSTSPSIESCAPSGSFRQLAIMRPSFALLDDPQSAEEAVRDTVREQIANACEKWLRWGEYLSIEIDTTAGTARVLPAEGSDGE